MFNAAQILQLKFYHFDACLGWDRACFKKELHCYFSLISSLVFFIDIRVMYEVIVFFIDFRLMHEAQVLSEDCLPSIFALVSLLENQVPIRNKMNC